MPVVVKLVAEFPGHEMTVLRVVAEYVDEHPEADAQSVEEATRERLDALLADRNHHNPAN
jgi:hypothetical protein